ncbi:enamine deaminase RidA (YjgF/YER057c/UK114 family) [Streptomyces glaucescens]|jgi:hypothetical protein
MSGYRSRSGNRNPDRTGVVASRRLRAAGWNISSSARKHKAEGVFVSGSLGLVSVFVDLGDQSVQTAEEIAQTVADWGLEPKVTHKDGHSFVHFRTER